MSEQNAQNFEFRDSSHEFGHVIVEKSHTFENRGYRRTVYLLMRCAGCHRGGLAKIHDNGSVEEGVLEQFYPNNIEHAKMPQNVPVDIASEFREAEICMSTNAWRGASALLRSTLEKTLKKNGYQTGSLFEKINQAASDGVITESRKKKHRKISES